MHLHLRLFEVPDVYLADKKYVSGVVDSVKQFTLLRHTLSKTIP